MSSEDLALFLRLKMGQKRIKNTDVVRKANISRRTWYRLLGADIQEAKLSTLIKVATALDSNVMEMLQVYFKGKKLSSDSARSQNGILGSGCDVNYPDNSLVNVGESFTKVWEVVNRSNEKRDRLTLKCLDEQLEIKMMQAGKSEALKTRGLTSSCQHVVIGNLEVGEAKRISITFVAPTIPCTVISHWRFFEDERMLSSDELPGLSCQVRVVQME